MSRYTGPKNRIARKFGVNIFGRLRNPLLHKPTPPGVHGAKRKKKSDYGLQLEEKQKLKACYGMITDKQLLRYFKKATDREGTTSQHLLQLLECRLDNVVYRLKFGATIFQAQQLVNHGHVLVNGKKVDIRSFQVKPGMVISIKEKSKGNTFIKTNMESTRQNVPEYLTLDEQSLKGELVRMPNVEEIPFSIPINTTLVCEFLAHTH